MNSKQVCIYCGSADVTRSDIIPSALTKKKIIRRNVCDYHNRKINDEAENIVITKFSNVRNDLNIPTRKGKDVPYSIKLHIDGNEFLVDNFISVLDLMNEGIDCISSDGKKVHIGKVDITKVKSLEDIEYFTENTTITSSFNFDFTIFKSTEMLRMVAKIGYEWYCNKFNVIYNQRNKKYESIINYIMRENPASKIDMNIVQIVTEHKFYQQIFSEVDCGTHALSITRDSAGMAYVIFILWGLVSYKIKIGYVSELYIPRSVRYDFYCIRYDGSIYNLHVPKLLDICDIPSEFIESGFEAILDMLKQRFEKLFNESIVSKNNLKSTIHKISKVLENPEDDSVKISTLFSFIDGASGTVLYFLIKLSEHSEDYNFEDTFNNNLKRILKTNETYYTSVPELTEFFRKKIENGTILNELKKGLCVYRKIPNN